MHSAPPPSSAWAALDVLERLEDGFVALDREARVVGMNRAAEGALGVTRAGVAGEGFASLTPPEGRAAFEVAFRGVRQDGQTRRFVADVRGRSFEVEVAEGGEVVVCVFHDLTSRRRHEPGRDGTAEQAEHAEHARRAQVDERRLWEALFEKAPAQISVLIGPEHRYAFVNALGREAVGGRELVGRTAREAFPELEGSPLFARIDEVFRTGVGWSAAEMPIPFARDGVVEERCYSFAYHPYRDASGDVAGILTIGFDVTDHVRLRRELEALAEERLQMAQRLETKRARIAESESRLARIFEGNLVGSVFWTLDGRLLRANDAFLELVGYTHEDVASGALRWTSLELPEHERVSAVAAAQLVETGRSVPFTMELLRKDGSRVPVLVSAVMFPGSTTEGVSFVVDLTDVRRAEQREARLYTYAAELSRAATAEGIAASFLASVAEAVPLVRALVVHKTDDALDALASHPHGAATDDVARAARDACADVLASGTSTDAKAHPALAAVGMSAVLVDPLVADGHVLGASFLGLSRAPSDEEERFVRALVTLTAQALERASLLSREQALRQKAEIANRTKDEFLATISHELRTPLNALLGWSRMLRTGTLPDAQKARALEAIERNAVAQAQLIDDLLDVSRIVMGKLRLDIQRVQVSTVVEDAVDAVRPAAAAKEIELVVDGSAVGDPIRADATRLQQIVWNLLSNAVKFTPSRGRVQVTARDVDGTIEIAVVDSGQGIPPEFLPHMFERFSQADGSITRRHAGLGLGLAICRHLVELHGGTVQAHSEGAGTGATFVVRIPRIQEDVRGNGRYRALGADMRVRLVRELRGLRALVVEDDEDARDLLATVLSQSGVEVRLVGTAAAAMDEILDHPPDVILCDVGLPDEDGYEFIGRVRELPPESGGRTPAAALTAYASAEDRRRAVVAGFHMHVPKPVDPRELLDVVASLARIAEASR